MSGGVLVVVVVSSNRNIYKAFVATVQIGLAPPAAFFFIFAARVVGVDVDVDVGVAIAVLGDFADARLISHQ
jgi:hypothetical protein